jgi:hypothetical protein
MLDSVFSILLEAEVEITASFTAHDIIIDDNKKMDIIRNIIFNYFFPFLIHQTYLELLPEICQY